MGEKKIRYECRNGGTQLTTVSLLSPSPTYTHLTLSCWSPSGVWSCSERSVVSGKLTAVGKKIRTSYTLRHTITQEHMHIQAHKCKTLAHRLIQVYTTLCICTHHLHTYILHSQTHMHTHLPQPQLQHLEKSTSDSVCLLLLLL